jgi:hypothetical protein
LKIAIPDDYQNVALSIADWSAVAKKAEITGYLSEGAIQPTIAKVFPLCDAAEAVRHLIEEPAVWARADAGGGPTIQGHLVDISPG